MMATLGEKTVYEKPRELGKFCLFKEGLAVFAVCANSFIAKRRNGFSLPNCIFTGFARAPE